LNTESGALRVHKKAKLFVNKYKYLNRTNQDICR